MTARGPSICSTRPGRAFGATTTVAVLFCVLAALLSCGDIRSVLAPGEIAALDRFESVSVGEEERALRLKLGPPGCVVTFEEVGQDAFMAACPEDGVPQALSYSLRRDWPFPLYAFPSDSMTKRVLAYADGTVFAYFSIDESGRVRDVDVWVS